MPPIRHSLRLQKHDYLSSFLTSPTFARILIYGIAQSQVKSRHQPTRLSGREYVGNLLKPGAEARCRMVLGMSPTHFESLERWLFVHGGLSNPDTKKGGQIEVEEQLAIFLYIIRFGASYFQASEIFQHSKYTIRKYFIQVTTALVKLYQKNVCLPPPNMPTPSKIRNNPKVYPYFKDCIGAGDGTHISVKVPTKYTQRFRNRKGEITQNCFFTCDFSGRITYVLPGWEGSAHDGRVLEDSFLKGFSVPLGRFYLMDAGYALRPGFLTPYRGVRYHLKEQRQAKSKPENKEELFNLRHAKERNIIERVFEILKKRFGILRRPLEYEITLQTKVIRAVAAVYNFIRDEIDEREYMSGENPVGGDTGVTETQSHALDDPGMRTFRDRLAQEMWEDYQKYLNRN